MTSSALPTTTNESGETSEEPASKWGIASPSTTLFDFDYTGGREQLLRLYDKGTRRQWIGSDRLDWSLDVDLDNPVGLPDDINPLFGTEWWDKMDDAREGRGTAPLRGLAFQPVHAR